MADASVLFPALSLWPQCQGPHPHSLLWPPCWDPHPRVTLFPAAWVGFLDSGGLLWRGLE